MLRESSEWMNQEKRERGEGGKGEGGMRESEEVGEREKEIQTARQRTYLSLFLCIGAQIRISKFICIKTYTCKCTYKCECVSG